MNLADEQAAMRARNSGKAKRKSSNGKLWNTYGMVNTDAIRSPVYTSIRNWGEKIKIRNKVKP